MSWGHKMSTTTIIIGNGLGRAIDNDYFKLESGLIKAKEQFTPDQIEIIKLGKHEMPESELELEAHHKISSSCNELISHGKDWLTSKGEKFPDLYQEYIYQVAKYFYDYDIYKNANDSDKDIFNTFINKLVEYMAVNTTHIATLNYDKLLYNALVEKKILDGYKDGGLVDGIYTCSTGFSPENLIRYNGKNFGWYLHLHGSPHFKTENNGNVTKCTNNQIPNKFNKNGTRHEHIVLASTELKPAIIANSALLDNYFDFFNRAISESDEIIILGYAGKDRHVNLAIKENVNKKRVIIEIIERKLSNETLSERTVFWNEQLGIQSQSDISLKIKSIDNILFYDFKTK